MNRVQLRSERITNSTPNMWMEISTVKKLRTRKRAMFMFYKVKRTTTFPDDISAEKRDIIIKERDLEKEEGPIFTFYDARYKISGWTTAETLLTIDHDVSNMIKVKTTETFVPTKIILDSNRSKSENKANFVNYVMDTVTATLSLDESAEIHSIFEEGYGGLFFGELTTTAIKCFGSKAAFDTILCECINKIKSFKSPRRNECFNSRVDYHITYLSYLRKGIKNLSLTPKRARRNGKIIVDDYNYQWLMYLGKTNPDVYKAKYGI